MKNCLYIVVPCYNEEEVLRETAKRLKDKLNGLIKEGKIANNSRITFVNDGSKDKTWDIISELHNEDKIFSGVNLSRNRGHQNALLAGLMTVKDYADMVISMDADLQDDINAVDGMVDKYMQGADIVYGVRNKRETDTFFKRFTAEGYYKVMKKMGVDLVFNHADYRLMSKRALEGLEDFKEVNLFLRGIVPQIGYKTDIETYERAERFAGESKYPLKKMLSFAWQGITSFSVKPMDMVLGVGAFLSVASTVSMVVMLIMYLCGSSIEAWMVILASIWLTCGFVMTSIGIVGAYIGKIYLETKERPRYIIKDFINEN